MLRGGGEIERGRWFRRDRGAINDKKRGAIFDVRARRAL